MSDVYVPPDEGNNVLLVLKEAQIPDQGNNVILDFTPNSPTSNRSRGNGFIVLT